MSEIHMETEDVREAARRVDLLAGELYFMPGKLSNLANSLSGMWQGGRAGRYASKIRKLAELVHTETIRLQRLAIKTRQEVGEWEEADHLGQSAMVRAGNMMSPSLVGVAGLPLAAGGAMVAVSSATIAAGSGAMSSGAGGGNLDLTWGLDVGAKGSEGSRRTKDFVEAKVGIEGDVMGADGRDDFMFGSTDIGGVKGEAKFASYEAGLKAGFDEKDGFSVGAFGEFDAAEAGGTVVLGGSLLGLTLGGTVSAGSADGFVGYKDGTAGASIGASAVSGEVALGANIAGVNVGVEAGAAAGVEFGITLGKKTKVKFGPFRLGLSFGKALTDQ